jgi:hypothetical protein
MHASTAAVHAFHGKLADWPERRKLDETRNGRGRLLNAVFKLMIAQPQPAGDPPHGMVPAKAHGSLPKIFGNAPGTRCPLPPCGKQMLNFFEGGDFVRSGFLCHRLPSFVG